MLPGSHIQEVGKNQELKKKVSSYGKERHEAITPHVVLEHKDEYKVAPWNR